MRHRAGVWILTGRTQRERRAVSRGLTKAGLDALDSALARHVERGDLPGLVALVARGDDGILLTQRMVTSPEPTELVTDFWVAAYAAIDT